MPGYFPWPFAGTWQLSQGAQQEYILSSWTFPESEATPLTGVVVAVLLFSFLLEILWHGASVTSSSLFSLFSQEFHLLASQSGCVTSAWTWIQAAFIPLAPQFCKMAHWGLVYHPILSPFLPAQTLHVIPQPQLFFQLSHKIFSLQLGINGHRAAHSGGQYTTQPGISLLCIPAKNFLKFLKQVHQTSQYSGGHPNTCSVVHRHLTYWPPLPTQS